MRSKLNAYQQFSFKLCINALPICFLSLMAISVHAEEKTTTNLSATMGVVAAPGNVENVPDPIIKKIPDDVQKAVEKELLSKIAIEKVELEDDALQVFRAPMYYVKPKLGYMAMVDGEVLDLNKASSSARLSGYLKLIKKDFVLDSEEKASLLGNAFHKAYPYKFKKIVKPVKVNDVWIVPIGKFFDNYSGLVFTTDEKSKITLVEFSLSINPEDFSYKPIPE